MRHLHASPQGHMSYELHVFSPSFKVLVPIAYVAAFRLRLRPRQPCHSRNLSVHRRPRTVGLSEPAFFEHFPTYEKHGIDWVGQSLRFYRRSCLMAHYSSFASAPERDTLEKEGAAEDFMSSHRDGPEDLWHVGRTKNPSKGVQFQNALIISM